MNPLTHLSSLQGKHWAILAAMLVSIGTQLTGLEHGWNDASTPIFIGGLLVQLGTTFAAIFVGSPSESK